MEIKLTDREAELMEILWQQGPSTVAEARDGLDDDLAYTTVLTMLRTLEAKGYVRHSAEGKAHRYEAAVARDVAQRSALKSLARKLFKAVGRVASIDESLMDAVTATCGSGPAYVFLLAEAMERAARTLGIDLPTARTLVTQTIHGAGRMLVESGKSPAELREAVTSREGTTAAALDVFQGRHFIDMVIEAMTAARDRGEQLGRP